MTILTTDRLIVRPFTLTDADIDDAFAIYNDPEVTKWIGDEMAHTTRDDSRELIEFLIEKYGGKPLGFWAIEERESGRVVGGAMLKGLTIGGRDEIELGYHFRQDRWGRGYATEVAHALLAYGFDTVGLTRIIGIYLPGNDPSGRVLRKIGMLDEGMTDYEGEPLVLLAAERPAPATS